MSDNFHSSFSHLPIKATMEPNSPSRNDFDDVLISTDTREEEDKNLDSSFNVQRDEEDPVYLSPRFAPSYEVFDGQVEDYADEEDDHYSIRAACAESSWNSNFGGSVREADLPQIPLLADCSSHKRERPSLRRSMAWSQDSMDDRTFKRFRREGSPTSLNEAMQVFSSDIPSRSHNRRRSSADSLHWEEKIIDPIDLISVVERVVTVSNDTM